MEDSPQSNQELEAQDIFGALNNYLLLLFSLSCILSSVFIQQIFASSNQLQIGIGVAPIIGILLPMFILTRRFEMGFRAQLSIRRVNPTITAYVLIASLIMVVVVHHLYMISTSILPTPVDYIEALEQIKPKGIWSTLLTFFGLCLVVPLAEEIIFRGVIQRVFSRNMSDMLAVSLAALFFGVIHLSPQLLIGMTSFGLFLGAVFYLTRNLSYTILSHGVFNAVAFLQLALAVDEHQETAPFYVQQRWTLLVAVAAVALLLWGIRKGAQALEDPPPAISDGTDSADVT